MDVTNVEKVRFPLRPHTRLKKEGERPAERFEDLQSGIISKEISQNVPSIEKLPFSFSQGIKVEKGRGKKMG